MKKFLVFLVLLFAVLFYLSSQNIINHKFNEEEFVRLLNQQRTSQGLSSLPTDKNLSYLAECYADICRAHGDISHNYILSTAFLDGVENVLVYEVLGEVLQMTTSESERDALTAWINSNSHQNILMNPDGLAVGIGLSRGDSLYIVVYVGRDK